MFAGLSFAIEARKLWKRLKREIKKATEGKPVDQVLAAYLLKKQPKSILLSAEALMMTFPAQFEGLPPIEVPKKNEMPEGMEGHRAVQMAAAMLGRYFQHKL